MRGHSPSATRTPHGTGCCTTAWGACAACSDGTLQSAAEYDPFGEPIVAPVGTAYGFTGELTDGNGLVYLRARYLAPSLGTFASRDPWRGSASAPRTWNGYAWVEGNVVNRVDASGMQSAIPTPTPTCPPTLQPQPVSTPSVATSTPDQTLVVANTSQPTHTPQAAPRPSWYTVAANQVRDQIAAGMFGPGPTYTPTPPASPTPLGPLPTPWNLPYVLPRLMPESIWPWKKAQGFFGERYIVPDAVIAAAGAVGAIGVGIGIALLPFPLNVIAGAAAGSAAVNTAEQITQLKQEPQNERVYTIELLSQLNVPEAALSGAYGGATTALAFATGGWSLVGSGIGGLIGLADAVTRGEGRVSFSTLSGAAWAVRGRFLID